MAEIVKLGWKVGGIVPIFAARKLGIKPFMVRKYLSELAEIGMVERVAKGYYMVKEKPEENLEAAIAKRLAQKSARRQKQ
jgi:predicted transcriptional regulator of viral defense system